MKNLFSYNNVLSSSDVFLQKILEVAHELNVDTDIAVISIADVLGIIAGLQDKQIGRHTIDERLDALINRIKETYAKVNPDKFLIV